MIKPIEEVFLKRVYTLSVYVSLWASSFLFLGTLTIEGFSLLCGSGIGILMIVMMEKTVKKLISQNIKTENKLVFVKWILIKYPLLGVLLYFLVRWNNFHIGFFTFGITLPYLVMVLKATGKLNLKGVPPHA